LSLEWKGRGSGENCRVARVMIRSATLKLKPVLSEQFHEKSVAKQPLVMSAASVLTPPFLRLRSYASVLRPAWLVTRAAPLIVIIVHLSVESLIHDDEIVYHIF